MNKNNVSIIQKILVFTFISILICTFYIARQHKIEKLKTKHEAIASNIEEVVIDSLTFLYNDDLTKIKEIPTIHPNYTETLENKFSSVNSTLKNVNMHLSNITLSKNRIYRTRKDSVKYIIYNGKINLQWASNTNKIETSNETKNIKIYLIEQDNNYYIANIEMTNIH